MKQTWGTPSCRGRGVRSTLLNGDWRQEKEGKETKMQETCHTDCMYLKQLSISCNNGRGEAPLSFRRAPRGLAMRRFGSGIPTQRRLRRPTPGVLGPRPSLLMKAAKAPSQRHLAPPPSSPNRLRVKAPKSDHCACGAAGPNGRHAARDAATVCARALRPLAHPTAHSHAQGTRVASTVGARKRSRAMA